MFKKQNSSFCHAMPVHFCVGHDTNLSKVILSRKLNCMEPSLWNQPGSYIFNVLFGLVLYKLILGPQDFTLLLTAVH